MNLAWVNLTNGGMCGGYLKYLRKILPHLTRDSRLTRLDMFTPAGVKGLPQIDNLSSHTFWPSSEKWQGFSGVRRAVMNSNPDLIFIPNARWLNTGIPTTVLVRNMEPMLPDSAGNPPLERLVNAARRAAAKRSCAKAAQVIAISDFVTGFLVDQWGVEKEKISRVYHGVESSQDIVPSMPAPLAGDSDAEFLFLAGSIRPFRGTEDAILALAQLKDIFPNLRLVIAGEMEGRVSGWVEYLRGLVTESQLTERVIWTRKLREAEMVWCFRRCKAFIMTSRVEACPNTALEAMTHGAVTVSTTNPPMPEFFGNAAWYYPAGNAAGLADRIIELMNSPATDLDRMAKRGKDRASHFTWQRCAVETVDAFERALANSAVSVHPVPQSRIAAR